MDDVDLRPGAWTDTLAVVAVALLVAAPGIGAPARPVFDEVYYVVDAVDVLRDVVSTRSQVHPPLGTWIVAAGVALVDGPVGWRLGSLMTSVMGAAALHRLGGRVLPPSPTGRLLAVAAPVLLVTDGSWLVMARTGMLDGPLTALVTATVAASVAAAAQTDERRRTAWLTGTGVVLGAATAVKWSGALAAPVVLLVLVLCQRRTSPAVLGRGARHAALVLGTALVTYAAAWVPFAVTRDDVPVDDCFPAAAPCVESGGLRGVIAQHASLVRFHTTVDARDVGETPPAGWPLMRNAMTFFRPGCGRLADVHEPNRGVAPACSSDVGPAEDTIRYVGNPVVWIGFLAMAPFAAAAVRRHDLLAAIALGGWTLQWLPWLAATRTTYIWWMAPAIPFAALGLVAGARRLGEGQHGRLVLTAAVGAAVGAAAGAVIPPGQLALAVLGWVLGPVALAAGATTDQRASAPVSRRFVATRVVPVVAAVLLSTAVAIAMRPVWTVSPTSTQAQPLDEA